MRTYFHRLQSEPLGTPLNTHPEDLKAAIRKTNRTLEGLSVELGYAPSAVGIALRRRWHEVRVGIAEIIGQPIQEIWPEDYLTDGTPKLSRPRRVKHGRRRATCKKARKELAA